MSRRRLRERLAAAAVALLAAVVSWPASAAERAGDVRSATEFLSPDLKAEQEDPARNRGMLWVDAGRVLWNEAAGPSGKSCAGCHGAPEISMRGVAARYPRYDAGAGTILNLEGRIDRCRSEHQRASPLAYESEALLGLTALVAYQSRGLPVAVEVDGPVATYYARGRELWRERQGQMNLACAHCHDDNVGRRLRGDTISSGVGLGYPVYRLEWQGLGSLHRRLRACQLGVRAVQYPLGSPEYLALELYLAWRARGQPMETPALRR